MSEKLGLFHLQMENAGGCTHIHINKSPIFNVNYLLYLELGDCLKINKLILMWLGKFVESLLFLL